MLKTTEDILYPNLNKTTVLRKQTDRNTWNNKPLLLAGGVVNHTAGRESVASEPDSWECKLDVVTACSKMPESVVVKLAPIVKKKINFLMKKFTNLEWLAYLIGADNYVTDLFIPNQTVTAGSVNVDKDTPLPTLPMIGVIHSHHTMGTFFSGTDDAYINLNHNISIVVAHNGMKAQARLKTPCGAFKTVEAKVVIDLDVSMDEKEFEGTVDERVTTPYIGNKYAWASDYLYGGMA